MVQPHNGGVCQPGWLRDPTEQSLLHTCNRPYDILHEQKVNFVVFGHETFRLFTLAGLSIHNENQHIDICDIEFSK